MRYELIKGYYIRNLDKLNWLLAKTVINTNKETKEEYEIERRIGYHATLEGAWNESVNLLALESKDFPDLVKTIKELKLLKKTIKQ